MTPVHRSSRFLVAVLLTGTLLRAFVPAGYMPAAPGKGLLFELCHDGMPPAIMAALDGHGHGHGSHGAHGHDSSDSDTRAEMTCAIGHLLSFAVIDAVDVVEPALIPPAAFTATDLPSLHVAAPTRAFSARAPPAA